MPCGGFDTLEPAAFFCAEEAGAEAIRAWGVSGCGLICSDGEIRSLSAEGGTTGGVPGLSGGQGLGEVGFPGECFV